MLKKLFVFFIMFLLNLNRAWGFWAGYPVLRLPTVSIVAIRIVLVFLVLLMLIFIGLYIKKYELKKIGLLSCCIIFVIIVGVIVFIKSVELEQIHVYNSNYNILTNTIERIFDFKEW